jgi:short-subunit dehydrogenase
MKQLNGKVAAITGAASGIGRALAINLASHGCSLAISDMNKNGLEDTAGMISGVKVTTHIVDVADHVQVEKYAADAAKKHGGVDIVINNAGVSLVDMLEDVSYEDYHWLFNINFWGVVHGTKAFLPYLRKRPEGHIVNISSINSMLPFPSNGPYNSSKFAVSGFSETLYQELSGTSIHISNVIPGGIKTNIANSARFKKFIDPSLDKTEVARRFNKIAMTTPDRAARIIISGIRKNKRRILVGADARFMSLCKRLFPVLSVIVTGKITKSYK